MKKCTGRDTQINHEYTRIILTFGHSAFAAAVEGLDKSKPIMPDYPVQITYRDFLDPKDVFIEKAMVLIEKQ